MDKTLFPELVQLITKTMATSIKSGIPIAHQWHFATPPSRDQERSQVDAHERHISLIKNLTVKEAFTHDEDERVSLLSLTVTDPYATLFGAAPAKFTPSREFPMLQALKHLGLDCISPNKINYILKPAFNFPHLRSLVLTDTLLDREGAMLLWRLFWQLEVLALIDVCFTDMSGVRSYMEYMQCRMFSRLEKLYLHYTNGGFPMQDQYQLLQACPGLRAFHWSLPKGDEEYVFTIDFLKHRHTIQPDKVREVEELHIVGEVDDYGIALALNNMPEVRSLSITVENRLGSMSLDAISNIAPNLTRFVSHSHHLTGAAIELVLSSCPMLHTLISRTVTAYEATNNRQCEWMCARSLKVLCLSFVFEYYEAHLQDEVCKKLAACTQLEQLIMHEPCNESPGSFGLRLRLDQGLGRLSTLRNLKFLCTLDDFNHPSRVVEFLCMDTIIFPEMKQLINKAMREVMEKGVPIANEWHTEIPAGPGEKSALVDEFKRRTDSIVNVTVDEAMAYNRTRLKLAQSLTVTDPFYTRTSVDRRLFEPPQPLDALVMVEHLGLDNLQPNKIRWFLEPICSFACLRSLIVTEALLDRRNTLFLWKVFPQLEVLSLINVDFLDMTAARENMKGMLCPRLKKLYLHDSNWSFEMQDQYQLLLACPSLEAFHWVLPRGG
ncbi:unnamed protein product [Mortierella alpina]